MISRLESLSNMPIDLFLKRKEQHHEFGVHILGLCLQILKGFGHEFEPGRSAGFVDHRAPPRVGTEHEAEPVRVVLIGIAFPVAPCRIDQPVQNGVLGLSILLLKDGAGQNGQIGREWWNVALVEDPDEGWTVVEHELGETADGPW